MFPGQRVGPEGLHEIGGYPLDGDAVTIAQPFKVMIDEFLDVLQALPQRGQGYGVGAQPEKEVLAKLTQGDPWTAGPGSSRQGP
jgi:hypothetical protein